MAKLSERRRSLIAFLYVLLISHCFSRTNKCNMTGDPDVDDSYTWFSTSDFVPLQGISCGDMYLGHVNTMEFDLVWNGRTTEDEAEMFFRVGFDSWYGTSCDGQQAQYPSFWITTDEDEDCDDCFMLGVSDEDSCNTKYFFDDYDSIEIGVNHHVEIYWDDKVLNVSITGGDKDDYFRSWNKTYPRADHIGDVVPVWFMSSKFGDTEYNKANGTFSNIVITSSVYDTITGAPTPEPGPSAEPTEEPFESTFEFTGITGETIEEDDEGGNNTVTVIVVILLLVLCCGGLWYYNKNNKREEAEVVFMAADPEADGQPKSRKKAPSHQRMRGDQDAVPEEELEFETGSQGQKVFKDIGAVAPQTMTYFKSPAIISSPVIDDEFNNVQRFPNADASNVIPEDAEDDHENQMQHPSPDMDQYANTEDDTTQMMMQKGPPPRPPPPGRKGRGGPPRPY